MMIHTKNVPDRYPSPLALSVFRPRKAGEEKCIERVRATVALALLTCCSPHSLHAGISSVFFPKPQGFYSMHYLRPQDDFVDRCEQPTVVSGIFAYHQSANASSIAQALFGTDTLQIAGSAMTSVPTNIVADNLGLPPDFLGTLQLCPVIKSLTFDFFYHLNLSNWCESLFIELSAPLVFTRWTLNSCETIAQRGSTLFASCYMSSDPAAQVNTASTIKQALSGTFLFGDMQEPWRNGKFVFEHQDKTRLADITLALGYNFYTSNVFRLSGSLLSIMPTGNNFQPTTVFYPLVGNGSHWTLGASLTANAHYQWDESRTFDAYLIGTFTHLFDNQQRRTFDFIGQGPLSRYLLLEEFNLNTTSGMLVYDNNLMNAVNFTTRMVEVACAIDGDIVAKATYKGRHSLLEGGYVFYGRTREHVSVSCLKVPAETVGHFYAPKGTTPVCAITAPQNIVTLDDLDLASGSAPSARVQTVFLQGGYQWTGACAESAVLVGVSGSAGSYGKYHALNEWSTWAEYRVRF